MLLTWMAAIGIYGTVGRRQVALDAVVWITAATYWLAALHQAQHRFSQPDVSCGQHALQQVAAHWGWFPNLTPGIELAVLIIGVEIVDWAPAGSSQFLGLDHRHRLSCAAHRDPGPAFAFVMFAGYAAALTPRQWVITRRAVSNKRSIVLLGH